MTKPVDADYKKKKTFKITKTPILLFGNRKTLTAFNDFTNDEKAECKRIFNEKFALQKQYKDDLKVIKQVGVKYLKDNKKDQLEYKLGPVTLRIKKGKKLGIPKGDKLKLRDRIRGSLEEKKDASR